MPVGPYYNQWFIILVVKKAVGETKLAWSWVFVVSVDASINRSFMLMRNIFFVSIALSIDYFRMRLWNFIGGGFFRILLNSLLSEFINFFPLAGSFRSVICYFFLRFKMIISVKGVSIFWRFISAMTILVEALIRYLLKLITTE